MIDHIYIKGARENNLKNIDVTIPRDKLIVFTGVSGSGKSSLAFDTLFAEGQRRYIESLSSYARMFLGQVEKPQVDYIEGLSPAVSIDQKTTSKNPRSTVGTVTEIYDYLRLFYAHIGVPHCPICGKEIKSVTTDEITTIILSHPEGTKIILGAPIARGKKGEFQKEFAQFKKSGFVRVRVDGIIYTLDEDIKIEKNNKHNIEVIVDRLVIKEGIRSRLTDSLETALKLTAGNVWIDFDGKEEQFSTTYACPDCGVTIPHLEPRMFSFNAPFGACPECGGLGVKREIDPNKVVKHPELSLAKGAIKVGGWSIMDMSSLASGQISALSKKYGFSMDTPYKELPQKIKDLVLYGTGQTEQLAIAYKSSSFNGTYNSSFEGIINTLDRRYRETQSDGVKSDIERYMTEKPCERCRGQRLKDEILAVTVSGKNINEVCTMPVRDSFAFFNSLNLTDREIAIAKPILKEIVSRLSFLLNVGLSYLTLARASASLSGGESQRIRLATQIGSGLTGVLYILDEPSIGLHQRDNGKLLNALKDLRDLGNTVIVVEHDEETMRTADYIVDIGAGAGENGGYLVACGSVQDIINAEKSITGAFLSGRRKINLPATRRVPDGRYLEIIGARHNNLKNITANIPVGLFTVITGVSGSGKSSLINGVLYPFLTNTLNDSFVTEGKYDEIRGVEYFNKIISIDQSPIGRTPRSNPATYIGLFTYIRELFAQTQDAKARGYTASRFSFNVTGGRCEKCSGDGSIKIEMHFLPDVFIPCDVCNGARYNKETLAVKYKGKSISEVLNLTVDESVEFFEPIPRIHGMCKCLQDVGLGYIRLGQSATTLSGGEAQRVKLASELHKRATGSTIYILDEPTTGLHSADTEKLITMLQRLTDNGNTVVVIEHNLDVIKTADFIIDLGPEGGDGGGSIVACGSPEIIAACPDSYTGQFLKKLL
ncbi:MAG: excinuclease ABC subunit UvrA [Christensenellaceae bacterium]|jgi:excinuclease ABC subunit A|nr:excinuclease ABC subunit UvrA [Christensenellaceae bacterium]